MTDEAKTCFEILKKAARFGVANCQLCPAYPVCPTGTAGWNNECTLETAADIIESLSDQLEQVTRERDAAVEDLEMLADCETCIHDDDEACEHCCDCITRGDWQWRGVEAER